MTWILTASGKHFNYLDPQPDQINILDIAQGLSRESRYNGQSTAFYSVAQHCVIASQIIVKYAPECALEALLHDASEAYCKDIPTPLKRLLPNYCEIEQRVHKAIRAKFGLPDEESNPVKRADLTMLKTEKRDFMPKDDDDRGIPFWIRPLPRPIVAVHAGIAHNQFMRRYLELRG